MIRTFQSLRRVDPGFRAAGLQTFEIFIPETAIKEPERVLRSFEETQRRLSEIPGVTMVAFGNTVPMGGSNSSDVLYAEDLLSRRRIAADSALALDCAGIFPDHGHSAGCRARFHLERALRIRDVAIVAENLAREMWRDPNAALGKRIREGAKDPWREIVGVVADVRHDGADQKDPATVYYPVLRHGFAGNGIDVTRFPVFLLRTDRAGFESLMNQVREAVGPSIGKRPWPECARWRRFIADRWRVARLPW